MADYVAPGQQTLPFVNLAFANDPGQGGMAERR
jgi:hypothetical protein